MSSENRAVRGVLGEKLGMTQVFDSRNRIVPVTVVKAGPCVVTLPEGTEMVMPGDNTEMSVQLIQPIAMDEGLRFAIREGGRTVGAGRVTKINK